MKKKMDRFRGMAGMRMLQGSKLQKRKGEDTLFWSS